MAKPRTNKDDHSSDATAAARPSSDQASDQASAQTLEQSLQQLEQLVQRMEDGEQSLDAALSDFETGIKLVRGCRDSLEQAEQRVQILLGDSVSPLDGNHSEPAQDA